MDGTGGTGSQKTDVRAIEARVERLLAALAEPPQVRARSEELVRVLMSLYGEGLRRAVALLAPDDVARLAEDELLASLLILHDLHPRTAAERIERSLERVGELLGPQGGAELIDIDDRGAALIRLTVDGGGCRSPGAAVRSAVEQAVLDAAPEIVEVRVEEVAARGPALLQIGMGPPSGGSALPVEGCRI